MIRLKYSLVFAVCVLALLSGAASAASPSSPAKATRTHSVSHVTSKFYNPPPPGPVQPPTVASDDWTLFEVAGSGGSGVTAESVGAPPPPPLNVANQHVYVLHGDAGVSDSPLPDTIKQDLLQSADPYGGTIVAVEDGGETVYAVSQEIAEGIDASETAGELTPEIEAIAEPLDDEDSGEVSLTPTPASLFGGSCATQEKSVSKVINLNGRSYTKTYNFGSNFTGTFTITGQLQGSVTAEIHFDVKRKKVIAWCVPYGVKFKNVHAFGNATSNAGVTATGTVSYHDSFGPSELAKPELFSVLFWIGPIPVDIGFNLPISAGLDISADLTGTINYNGTHVATGSFDYTCTLDDCFGSSSFDNTSPTGSTQEITGSVAGHVKPVPYVDVGFRAYLYTESIAYAQVGVRPYVLGDLWGFTGNNCGDADGNGNTESVQALTFDLDRRIDLTGQASVFGGGPWSRTLHTGAVAHVGFYDLINSSALQPQFQGPASLDVNKAGAYKVRMRSCWPYTDNATYQVNWGDGSAVQSLQGAPATEVQASHTWTAAGTYAASATSISDAHGRALNQAFPRSIEVKVPVPLSVTVTPSPASATSGSAITWTATAAGGDPATTKFAFFRRLAGSTPWTPDVTQAAWQTGNVFTWTPTAADLGFWEIIIWVKDANTSATANTYGFAAYVNAGPVQVVAPLAVTSTPTPAAVVYGTPVTWTATATGGTPGTIQYTVSRQLAGTTTWLPNPQVWQSGNVLSWTPAAADVGTWTIAIAVKDINTAPNANGYGYAAYTAPGTVQVVAPLSVTVTPSPASSVYGNPLTWTATATGGLPASTQFAFFRRRAGTTPWTPDVTAPAWQSSNVFSWTPTLADAGGAPWEIVVWVKDGLTTATANTYGYSAYANAGPVQVTTPPLTLAVTPSPASVTSGNPVTWTATASGGNPSTTKFAFFRRLAGTAPWTPDVSAPNWQTGNVFTWTPTAADAGTWEIVLWVKDGDTPATMNTYGFAAYVNAGPVQVVGPLTMTSTASPATATSGTIITWTASSTGGVPGTIQYTVSRQLAGTSTWLPSPVVWQSGNILSWSPTAADVGTWTIAIAVRDANTAPNANGYGYAAYTLPGAVQVVAPLTLTTTGSPASSPSGTSLTWTATASGGVPASTRYAFFRRRAGTTPWTPDVSAPAWQSGNVFNWTPAAADAGTWEIVLWVKDGNTAANANGYGYAAYVNAGPVQVYNPITLTGSGSPSSANYNTTLTWTANASGGTAGTFQYAFFRRRAGTTPWTPDVSAPAWQTSNVMSWTPGSGDAGTFEIIIWVKDANTPSTLNGYGYGAYYNAGPVTIVAPLSVTGTGSPATSVYGNTICWTAYASGGTPATTKYAFFRRLAGTTPWTPDVTAPSWQSSNVMCWTPGSTDVGIWEIIIWVKDGNTPPNYNLYGYAAYYNAGPVQIVTPPLTLTGTGSPASSTYGNTINWTLSAGGGTPATTRYAFFRRLAGTSAWTPDVTAPAWQSSNVFSWTPGSADVGTWEIIFWVKDGDTPSTMNGYGFAAYYNAMPVQVVAPLSLTGTGSPSSSPYGTTITWTATASGGTPSTTRYALFRRLSGTSSWIPDVTAPNWQSSNVLSWTPGSGDVGTWEIIIWVKDGNTPSNMNGYGFAAYYNAMPVQVTVP